MALIYKKARHVYKIGQVHKMFDKKSKHVYNLKQIILILQH